MRRAEDDTGLSADFAGDVWRQLPKHRARLRQARTAFPLSREEMAAYLGVSVATIQRFENGSQRIPAGRLWQMCNRLNLELGEIFADLPHQVVSTGGLEEPDTSFDHEDGRSKPMNALTKAARHLSLDRLEIAVVIVKALKVTPG